MHPLSSIDVNTPIVADTSVIINLIASGIPATIISAIGNPFLVTDEILVELEVGAAKGFEDATILKQLIETDIVEVVSLGEGSWRHFEKLISGSASATLDDGEAATLAYCAENNTIPAIDERKANRICRDRYPTLSPISSASLFCLSAQSEVMESAQVSDALFRALTIGRMRVMESDIQWVVEMIGKERAYECTSLPQSTRLGYRD